jgi:hypothetical protein
MPADASTAFERASVLSVGWASSCKQVLAPCEGRFPCLVLNNNNSNNNGHGAMLVDPFDSGSIKQQSKGWCPRANHVAWSQKGLVLQPMTML